MVESVFCKYFWKNKKIEKDTEKFQKLKDEYKKIREILNLLHESGQVTLYEKQTLISMIKKVTRNLAANYKRIREGVEECMGGKVLMHEAEALTQSGIRKGIALEKKNTERERQNAERERQNAEFERKRADEAMLEITRLRALLEQNGIHSVC